MRDAEAPVPDLSQLRGKIPLLGVCYGAQLMAQHNGGGNVEPSNTREYGRAKLNFVDQSCPLVKNMSEGSQVWMSHGDTILNLPTQFEVIASTHDVKVAGYHIENEKNLRDSVPSGGLSFYRRHDLAKKFRCRYLWL